ncbi:ATP-dependent DNA helicase AdnB [Gordonia jinhuaensis]|uniref:DNA 3'-5' helicase n=1 Tax=Gordonia jinhuaensis TaxID=1517702 RepID=A0A916T922_9ACTN|nr:UvrD-helicase domain-containing protein [Gordonia jinhuaensis]GGB34816.1 ATP-dependent DNA helicase [Gordonia jinhuaensis]
MTETIGQSPVATIGALDLARALRRPPPTPEQVAVIEAPLEPLLVVAGAGAGKTETMASRVVWLVANRLVTADEVLGLTFTRKAASELAQRVRTRLAMLAGTRELSRWDVDGSLRDQLRSAEPEISTYHAYAGRLVADHGLLLPVEPSSTMLSETELWQLAYSVVAAWPEDIATSRGPAGVTRAVLNLYGEAAEHLVDLDELQGSGDELYDLIDALPKGKGQRDAPSAKLRGHQDVIAERRALLPLVVRLAEVLRENNMLDFASQMSLAARLVRDHPEVVATERADTRAVLLDEYQDTGHSQRILLSHLFGTPGASPSAGPGIAVTAVGDPIQSIYGWRGASAANLPRFAGDFRRSDRRPAHRLELLTSWRNSSGTLDLANAVSADLRARGVPVSTLQPRPGAPAGTVDLMLAETVVAEREWVADRISERWTLAEDNGEKPPATAVLVRRNEDSAPLAAEIEKRGIPVEVVGIGGLLGVPEVADVVAMLALIADPLAGSAAMRLLTGAKFELGAADLSALWRRARELAADKFMATTGAVTAPEELDAALDAALPGELADVAGLGDALADPGPPDRYSPAGYRRIRRLGEMIDMLRRRVGAPLPDLVGEVEHELGLDVEVSVRARRMRGNISGREHLDAFADYVADYADRGSGGLAGLLAYLDAADEIERGLEQGRIDIADDRVQILTVHAAKGLEWDVVAIPHLTAGVFPSDRSDTTWLGSAAELPAQLRGDLAEEVGGEGFPPLEIDSVADRKELEVAIEDHKQALRDRRLDEDRRLLYVALTRARDALIISGSHWMPGRKKPSGPSAFLTELHQIVSGGPDVGPPPGMRVHGWPDPIADGADNPLDDVDESRVWPVDHLGTYREAYERAAQQVRAARDSAAASTLFDPGVLAADGADPEIDAWRRELEALLNERRQIATVAAVELPKHLSVSQLVDLDRDEEAFARRIRRPVPLRPNPMARRGTAFHAWVERRFGATRLLDLDELPGAADAEDGSDADLELLQRRFLESRWADRTPQEIEVPFETTIGGIKIRGRMDAVFAEPDGRWTVVDWKTGAEPTPDQRESAAIQLAAYRIAWARLRGIDVDKVRAAFHYVRSGRTLEPRDLPGETELAELLSVNERRVQR